MHRSVTQRGKRVLTVLLSEEIKKKKGRKRGSRERKKGGEREGRREGGRKKKRRREGREGERKEGEEGRKLREFSRSHVNDKYRGCNCFQLSFSLAESCLVCCPGMPTVQTGPFSL